MVEILLYLSKRRAWTEFTVDSEFQERFVHVVQCISQYARNTGGKAFTYSMQNGGGKGRPLYI
jgi:hypothetical protein